MTRSCCCGVPRAATTATSRSASSPATSSPGAGWSHDPPAGRRGDPRAVGVADRPRHARRRPRGDLARGAAARARRRARPARGRAARPGRAGRHAGQPARGQGPRVGRRLPRRRLRRAHADLDGRGARRGRGGAPAALRRPDPSAASALPLVVRRAHPGGPRHPSRLALPRPGRRHPRPGRPPRAGPRGGGGRSQRPQGGAHRALPRLRRRARHRRPAQDRPLRRPARPPTTRRRSSGCAPGDWPWRARRACRHSSSSPTRRSPRSPRRSPSDEGALSMISGVGARKLEQYGSDVLAILQGADPQELLEKPFCRKANPTRLERLPKKVPENFVNSVVRPRGARVPLSKSSPVAQVASWGAREEVRRAGLMDNTTMTMNAVACVLSVRPRLIAGPVRLAAALAHGPGDHCVRRRPHGWPCRRLPRRLPGRGLGTRSAPSPPPTRPSMSFAPAPGGHRSDPDPKPHLQAANPTSPGPRPSVVSGHLPLNEDRTQPTPPAAHRPVPDRSGTQT